MSGILLKDVDSLNNEELWDSEVEDLNKLGAYSIFFFILKL